MPNVSLRNNSPLETNLPPPLAGNALLQPLVNPLESVVSKGLQDLENSIRERLEQGLKTSVRISDVQVPLEVQNVESTWILRLAANTAVPLPDLGDLMNLAGGKATALPEDLIRLTEVALSDVEVRFDSATHRITRARFVVSSLKPWSLSALPGVAVENLRLQLEVSNPTSQPALSLDLTGELRLGKRKFRIHAERKDGRWLLSTPTLQESKQTLSQLVQDLLLEGFTLPLGIIDPNVPDLKLSADLQAKRLTLSSTTPARASFGPVSFESQSFEVRLWCPPGASVQLAWHVALDGSLKITDKVTVSGELVLAHEAGKVELAFEPRQADTAPLPLPIPRHPDAAVSFSLGTTRFTFAGEKWQIESSASVAFSGLPEPIQTRLPARIQGTVKGNQDGVTLTVDRLLQAEKIKIPSITVKGDTIVSFDDVMLDAYDFTLELDENPRFFATFELGGLSNLNKIFGTKPDGTPNVEFFSDTVKVELSVSAEGVKLSPQSSPIEAITFEPADGEVWATLNMGEFGAAQFQVPTLMYDAPTNSLRASGAFKITKQLSVPTSLFKRALVAAQCKHIADLLPDTLPCTEFKPLGADGKLDAGHFIRQLERITRGPVPQAVKDIVNVVAERINDLPERFRNYLRIEAPNELFFDLRFSADAGIRIDVKAPGDKPLRMFFPMINNALQWLGVEVRGLAFGEMGAGLIFLVEADARVDVFDLVTLVAALTGVHRQVGLPPSSSHECTFIFDKVFMPFCLATGEPLPMAMFFEQLGMKYAGIEGGHFETNWYLPLPGFNLREGAQLTEQLVRFVTEPKYLLPTDGAFEDMKLRLEASPFYLMLPDYLDRKELGTKDKTVKLDLFNKSATVLNTLKTGNFTDLVPVIPIQYRVGQEKIDLGPLKTEVDWLLTTATEFRTLSHERLGVVKAASDEVLSVVPADGEKGLVVLMKGLGNVGGVEVESVFGLAVNPAEGMSTGFSAVGTLAQVGRMELSGQVSVPRPAQPPAPGGDTRNPIQLSGRLALVPSNGVPVFDGQVSYADGESMNVSGKLDLFPRSPRQRITGQLQGRISPGQLAVSGSVSLALGSAFSPANARAELTHKHVKVIVEWMDQTVSFAARKKDPGLQLEASLMPVSVGDALLITDASGQSGPSALLDVGGDGVPRLAFNGAIKMLGVNQATRLDFSEQGVQFEVSGKLFNRFDATVKVRGGSLNGDALQLQATMRGDLSSYLQEHATRFIQSVTDGVTRELNTAQSAVHKAQAEVNRLNGEIAQMRRTVQAERERDQQRLAAAQAEVQKAQATVNQRNGEIQHLRGVIEGERRGVQRQLEKAQADLNAAQREVDRIRGEIDATHRWYNGLPKTRKILETVPYKAKIAALTLALEAATRVLNVGRQALEALQRSVNLAPIEKDLRMVGLIAAQEVASKALAVTQAALAAIQRGMNTLSIEADFRVVGLVTAQNAATGALKLANQALEQLKSAVGEAARVGDYITQQGPGKLLEVRSSSFEASLNAAHGGRVTLRAEVMFMGNLRQVSFTQDLKNDPQEGARALANLLLPARR